MNLFITSFRLEKVILILKRIYYREFFIGGGLECFLGGYVAEIKLEL